MCTYMCSDSFFFLFLWEISSGHEKSWTTSGGTCLSQWQKLRIEELTVSLETVGRQMNSKSVSESVSKKCPASSLMLMKCPKKVDEKLVKLALYISLSGAVVGSKCVRRKPLSSVPLMRFFSTVWILFASSHQKKPYKGGWQLLLFKQEFISKSEKDVKGKKNIPLFRLKRMHPR